MLPVFEVKKEISVLFVFMSGSANKTAPWKWGLSDVLVILIAALATNREFYDTSMTSAFLSLALASGLIILLVLRRSWADLFLALAGGALLALIVPRRGHPLQTKWRSPPEPRARNRKLVYFRVPAKMEISR